VREEHCPVTAAAHMNIISDCDVQLEVLLFDIRDYVILLAAPYKSPEFVCSIDWNKNR
jgi:hypothetical protein